MLSRIGQDIIYSIFSYVEVGGDLGLLQVCIPGGSGSSTAWWWSCVMDILPQLKRVQDLVRW